MCSEQTINDLPFDIIIMVCSYLTDDLFKVVRISDVFFQTFMKFRNIIAFNILSKCGYKTNYSDALGIYSTLVSKYEYLLDHKATIYTHETAKYHMRMTTSEDCNSYKKPSLCDLSLAIAAKWNQIELVEFLLDNNANVHVLQNYAVRSTVTNGNVGIIKLLLAYSNYSQEIKDRELGYTLSTYYRNCPERSFKHRKFD